MNRSSPYVHPKEYVNPPPPPPSDVEWRKQAACAGADPAQMDAGKSSNPPDRAVVAAWAMCSWCPVLADCRAWAERLAEPGVLGGQWRVKENPLATRVYVTDLLTPAMRARYDALAARKAAA